MGFRSIGLAGLVVAAIRKAVADPELQDQVNEQGEAIAAVSEGMTGLTAQLTELKEQLASNDAIDDEQREQLEGIIGELESLGTALAGPADDATDNGVIGEVQPVEGAEPSPSADEALDAAEALGG